MTQASHESLKKDLKEEGYGCCESQTVHTQSQGTPSACWYICVVELCERLAFYTFNGSIAFFLERVGFSLVNAGGITASMTTLCFLFALVASWAADVMFGRFKTILFSGILYIIGSVCAASGTWPGSESIPLFFLGMLVFIPMATA